MTGGTAKKNGFTLIEASIALIVLGIIMAGVLTIYDRTKEQRAIKETKKNMADIVKALADYAEINNRLPCPADPAVNDASFGWEWGIGVTDIEVDKPRPVGSCDNTAASAATNNTTGVVPYQTLNLPYRTIRDGWGRYFTYAVSPVFAQNNDVSDTNNDNISWIHERCRTKSWVTDDSLNSPKARFCCAATPITAGQTPPFPPNSDLRIQLHTDPGATTANDISPVRIVYTPPALPNTSFDAIDALLTDAGGNPTDFNHGSNIIAPAFVLISHGLNGDGAYLSNTPGSRNTQPCSGGACNNREQENFDLDRLYYTGEARMSGGTANYFDDIVVWRTQDGIMAHNGTSSCQYP